jgi:hypothetical protein
LTTDLQHCTWKQPQIAHWFCTLHPTDQLYADSANVVHSEHNIRNALHCQICL